VHSGDNKDDYDDDDDDDDDDDNNNNNNNNKTCNTNCKYRTVAILHTLEKWFVSVI
jgi:hypothetical protein